MSKAIVKSNAADHARAKAGENMEKASALSLHELVDEFQRLTMTVEANLADETDEFGELVLLEAAEVARRERAIINGAARARFGISFSVCDRRSGDYQPF